MSGCDLNLLGVRRRVGTAPFYRCSGESWPLRFPRVFRSLLAT
jgi:hypothetical protein